MASRIDYSQNRKLYVGTTAELSVADGETIIDNKLIIGGSSSSLMLDVASDAIIGSINTGSSTINYENKLIVAGKNNYSDGTTWFGSYGQILLSSNTNMTGGARQFLITNALDNTKFAIIRSVDASTNPVTDSTASGVNSGTADLVIDNTGNVGIGTTSPGANLDVAGAAPVIRITNTTDPLGNGTVGSFEFFTNDSSTGATRTVSSIVCDNQAGSAVPGGDLVFKTSLGGSGSPIATEKMRIDMDGNVGIGNTSPDFRLHTNLNLSGTPLAYLNGTSNTFDATVNLGVTHNSTAVGTGTAAGVYLANNANNDGAPSPIIAFSALSAGGSYNHTYAAIYGIKTAGGADTNWVKGDLTFATGNTTGPERRMTILANGNVGIGTVSPGYKLQVGDTGVGDGNIAMKANGSGADAGAKLTFNMDVGGGNANSYIAQIVPISYDSLSSGTHNSLNFKVGTWNNNADAGVSRMTILSNGQVGIGTTNPAQNLVVADATNGNGVELVPGATATIQTYNRGTSSYNNLNIDTARTQIRSFDYTSFHNGSGYGEKMRIDSSGNVGIGTTSPENLLHVQQAGLFTGIQTTAGIRIKSDGASAIDNYHGTIALSRGTGSVAISAVQEASDSDVMGMAFFTHPSATGVDAAVEKMRLDQNGNLGIGTTSPGAKLEIVGDSITRSKTRGLGTNYATSEGWVAGAAGSFTSRIGYFGGNFTINGATAENKVEYDIGPFGSRELVWKTIPETGNNDDGGWNKSLDGFNNSANNGFMSIVYVRRDAGTAAGNFYHGCSGSNTLNLDGTTNTNPYFSGTGISVLPADVWCVAIGIIYATNDTTTTTSALGGIYRLDTGQKIENASSFRQQTSNVAQAQRVYHYYSTSTTAQLDFANPGWYILDGSEPSLGEILGSGSADDAFWSANGNDIYNDNSGNVGIGTTSPLVKLQVYGNAMPATGDAASVEDIFTLYRNGSASVWAGGATLALGRYSTGGGTFPKSRLDFKLKDAAGSNTDLPETTVMTMQSNGNVGIGTTSPAQKLHVGDGGIRVEKSATGLGGFISVGNATELAGNYSAYFFGNTASDTGYFKGGIAYETLASTYGRGDMHFLQNSTTAVANVTISDSVMTILNGGNVGIGTTSPSATLVVSNGGAAGIELQPEQTTDTNRILNYDRATATYMDLRIDANAHQFMISGTERMRITSTGNVGIGTTGPGNKLSIAEDMGTTFSDAFLGLKATLAATANTKTAISLATSTVNNYGVTLNGIRQEATSGEPRFGINMHNNSSSGIEALSIRASGNVGIGTTSPSDKLDILTTTGPQLRLTRNAGTEYSTLYSDSAGGLVISSYSSGSANYQIFSINSSEKVRIINNGNVGIGTTAPEFKLEVDTNGVHDGIKIRGANAPGLTLQDDSSASLSTILIQSTAAAQGNLRIAADTNNVATDATIEFQVSGSERMRISNAGAIRFNDYGAGTLVTDASGNITAATSGAGTGTVTSITKGAGLVVAGSPITTTGSVAVEYGGNVQNIITGGNNFIGDTAVLTDQILITDPGVTSTNRRVGNIELGDLPFLPFSGGTMTGNLKLNDNIELRIGSSNDLKIVHESNNNSYIQNITGDLYIRNFADNKDIIFQSDNGSGSATTYFMLDGERSDASNVYTVFPDNSIAAFGNSANLKIYYSSSKAYLDTTLNVDLVIPNAEVGIGTTSPAVKLDVSDEVSGSGFTNGVVRFENSIEDSTGGAGVLNIQNNYQGGFGTLIKFWFEASSVASINFNSSTSAVVYNTTSDYRLKEDLKSFNGLEIIDQIKTYNYKWKKADARGYGALAHELQEVFPDAVTGEKDGEDMQGVDYSTLVPVLIKSIQELKAEIELLKQK